MRSLRRRAVLAAALPEVQHQVRGLLETAGFSETVCVSDGRSALVRVQECLPDAVIADAVLPGLDGFELIRRIRSVPLEVIPSAVVLALPGIRPAGAEEIFGCSILEKPVTAERIAAALEMTAPEKRKIPEKKHRLAVETLSQIGLPEHCGRDYLARAAELVWQDGRLVHRLTKDVYPLIAAENGAAVRHVERAMRYAIDAAWRVGEIDAQYKLFGDTVDAKRGSPTCGEMIARIADILRWEGRA